MDSPPGQKYTYSFVAFSSVKELVPPGQQALTPALTAIGIFHSPGPCHPLYFLA
jgi:hypothetical protein